METTVPNVHFAKPGRIELRLRAELEQAERELQRASSEELAEARLTFKIALHRFTRPVLHGELPRGAMGVAKVGKASHLLSAHFRKLAR